ncbi:hypothetical protein D9M71_322920 [compost metagenome]|uniref:Globin n=1 Tax=Pseudomonas linyingensis TaxID=915471 RepID=A0A1H7D1K6_9PSED|nr:hypothetical protein SAMN05216201_1383 [Pseudomonas linyingensis]
MKNLNPANRVMQSYGRCCANQNFFDTFYQHFLASSPAVRDKFVKTDMTAQKHLLRAGILNLVLYARGMSGAMILPSSSGHPVKR